MYTTTTEGLIILLNTFSQSVNFGGKYINPGNSWRISTRRRGGGSIGHIAHLLITTNYTYGSKLWIYIFPKK